jgi:site-specific DNA recombinase
MPPAKAGSPLVAGIYCRISDDTEGLALGVARQEKDGKALADEIGATVHAVYTDNDIGASTRSKSKARPDYDRLLADARSGVIDCIIYYSNSRLTRRPLEYEDIIQLVEKTGVRLASVVSNNVDLTTADGRMMGRMQAVIDAAEVERAAERVIRKLAENREQGKVSGGKHPHGWLPPDPLKGIGYMTHLDPVAVKHINNAADWLLLGATRTQVMRRWIEAGWKTLSGRNWTLSSVQRVLANPSLAGLLAYRGEVVGKGQWPAVIGREKWEAIQPLVRPSRGKGQSRDAARRYLLSGFLACGDCGATLTAMKNEARGRRYACVSAERGGCGGVTRNAEWLETVLRAYVAEMIRKDLEDAPAAPVASAPAEQLTETIDTLEARLAEAREAAGAGLMSMIDAGVIMTDLREQITTLRAARARAWVANRQEELTPQDLLAQWGRDDLDTLGERRSILARYVKKAMVHRLPKGKWTKANMPLNSITIIPV